MRNPVTRYALPGILLSALAVQAGAGDVFTWKDAEGRTHFGDKPPAEAKKDAQKVEATEAYSPGTDKNVKDIYQRTNRMFDAKDKIRQENAAAQQKQAEEHEAQLKQACYDARERVHKLSGPVIFVDDYGREIKSSDAERKQQLEETREWVAKNCP